MSVLLWVGVSAYGLGVSASGLGCLAPVGGVCLSAGVSASGSRGCHFSGGSDTPRPLQIP